LYIELATTNAWTGFRTKANQSGFVARQEGGTIRFSWNCGQDGHMLKDCKKEKNQAAIDSRKKAFNKAKAEARKEKKDGKKEEEKKEAPKTRKWAPPQPNEKNKELSMVSQCFGISKLNNG
jgi:Zinc knuckle